MNFPDFLKTKRQKEAEETAELLQEQRALIKAELAKLEELLRSKVQAHD